MTNTNKYLEKIAGMDKSSGILGSLAGAAFNTIKGIAGTKAPAIGSMVGGALNTAKNMAATHPIATGIIGSTAAGALANKAMNTNKVQN